MSVLGIISEYNPFHNGHLYHLMKSKELSGAENVICIMSGNFIQRGEPAIVNKWARTRMALMSGADLVIELPTVYAMSSAEYFAYGAVRLLDSLGIVDYICFGSESGNIHELEEVANILYNEPNEYKIYLKQALAEGLSYPSARQEAIKRVFKSTLSENEDLHMLLVSSNNILGIEYLKSLKRLNSCIKPLTIPRVTNNYNQQDLTGDISSATAIRRYISERNFNTALNDLRASIPESSVKVLREEFTSGRGPVFSKSFENIILAELRKMSVEKVKQLPYIGEGLENRIKKAADNSGNMEELIDNISTRRYTRTRIQRCIFNIITGLTSEEFDKFNMHGGPQYLRILGFNRKGRELLSLIGRNASLPLIVKTADYKNSCNALLKRMLEIEARSTDIYVLGYEKGPFKIAGQEFTQNIVRVM